MAALETAEGSSVDDLLEAIRRSMGGCSKWSALISRPSCGTFCARRPGPRLRITIDAEFQEPKEAQSDGG